MAIVTRAAPAKLIGLDKVKGHLGIGADADIAIYDIDPNKVNLSRDHQAVIKAFKRAAYTIKDGEVVVIDGEIVKTTYGRTFYVKSKGMSHELVNRVVKDVSEKFKERYSVCLVNYVIGEEEIRRPFAIEVQAKVGG